jgi:exodeoxyribonuclease VII small subunit
MTNQSGQSEIGTLSYEQALAELESIVTALEQGDVALEKSIEIYERGELLKKHCEKLLNAAEAKVEKIRVGADGTAKGSEPLDSE